MSFSPLIQFSLLLAFLPLSHSSPVVTSTYTLARQGRGGAVAVQVGHPALGDGLKLSVKLCGRLPVAGEARPGGPFPNFPK